MLGSVAAGSSWRSPVIAIKQALEITAKKNAPGFSRDLFQVVIRWRIIETSRASIVVQLMQSATLFAKCKLFFSHLSQVIWLWFWSLQCETWKEWRKNKMHSKKAKKLHQLQQRSGCWQIHRQRKKKKSKRILVSTVIYHFHSINYCRTWVMINWRKPWKYLRKTKSIYSQETVCNHVITWTR